jgi:hypothetical protein
MSLRAILKLAGITQLTRSRRFLARDSYDAEAQIGLGGAATEHPHCMAPAADFARDDFKTVFHANRNTQGGQQDHA